VVEVDGADQLLFKHAIATIETPRAVANYFASPA
jgi:sRNA-binding regulator protein Hfq